MELDRRSSGALLFYGIIGGIIAGIVFMAAEMVISLAMGGAVTDPLRLIGSTVLEADALSPTYPLVTAVGSGIVVHLVLSALYGVIYTFLLAYSGQLGKSTVWLLVYGWLFGLALWAINFLIIAPIVWPQFALIDQFWNGLVVNAFLYGLVLGAYIASVRPASMGRPSYYPFDE